MTLIEIVIAIVVVGICVVGALALLSSISVNSSKAMVRTQSTAIASAYLDNVLSLPFAAVVAYNVNHAGARDSTGNVIVGLESYNVRVETFADTLSTGTNAIGARRVEVTVTDPLGATTRVTGYRTNFANQVLY